MRAVGLLHTVCRATRPSTIIIVAVTGVSCVFAQAVTGTTPGIKHTIIGKTDPELILMAMAWESALTRLLQRLTQTRAKLMSRS